MRLERAVFLDFASLHPQDLDPACLHTAVAHWQWRDNTPVSELDAVIADADAVVVNKVELQRSQLEKAKQLKLICTAATGVNNIDVAGATALGISVCNARGYATPSVVQHVFAQLLTLVTRLDAYRRDVQTGRWSASEFFCLLDYPVRELQGMTLGIIGYGELGRAVARVAQAFGMTVLLARRDAADTREGRLDLHELLPQVDVLSLHCPLTDETRGIIGEAELALMKPDAILINTARGGLVDETALLEALQQNRLGGAALDVLAQEPPPEDSLLLQQPLPNLIITPHTAWASREARQRVLQEVADNLAAFQAGRLRNAVN